MKHHQKSGFTLLEVIIVVIIVAIMASVAMPKITSSINFSKAKEALSAISMIRQAMDECYTINGNNYSSCRGLADIGIVGFRPKYFEDPEIRPDGTGAHYFVRFTSNTGATDTITYYTDISVTGYNLLGKGVFGKIMQ